MFKYLVANDRDVSWGLYVDTIGYEEIKPGEHYPTQGHANGFYFDVNRGRNPKPICVQAMCFYCFLANGIRTAPTPIKAGSATG